MSMFTRWDLILWASGFLGGFGGAVMVMQFLPKRFHFTHGINLTVTHRDDSDNDGEGWKRL